jgi:hypothetical protein
MLARVFFRQSNNPFTQQSISAILFLLGFNPRPNPGFTALSRILPRLGFSVY